MEFCVGIIEKLVARSSALALYVRKTPARGYRKISLDRFTNWYWDIPGVEANTYIFLGCEIDAYLDKTFKNQSDPTKGTLYFKFVTI